MNPSLATGQAGSENRGKLCWSALLLLFPAGAWASFQNTPLSVKAEGMGGAYVGLADDPSAVFLNPAGLSTLQASEASLMYGKPFYGVDGLDLAEGYSAIGVPLGKRVSLGLGASMFRASGILSEYQFVGGLSTRLNRWLAIGASADYLYHHYDIAGDASAASQPAFADGSAKGAVGISAGLMAFLSPKLQVGISVRNLNRPDVGLKESDPVPLELRIGSLYRFQYLNLQAEIEQRDDGLRTSQSQSKTWKLGVEVPIQKLAFRAGVNNDALTAGFGLRLGPLGLDYAFSLYRSAAASDYGSHLLAVSYRLDTTPEPAKTQQTTEAPLGIFGDIAQ